MEYVWKTTPEMFYLKLNEKLMEGRWASHVMSDIESFMSEYKNDPLKLIEKIAEFITNSANEIDDFYREMPDDKFMNFVDYPDDVRKIQEDFSNMGFTLSPLEAEAVWETRSDNWMAGWLHISSDTDTFLECVLFGIIQPC